MIGFSPAQTDPYDATQWTRERSTPSVSRIVEVMNVVTNVARRPSLLATAGTKAVSRVVDRAHRRTPSMYPNRSLTVRDAIRVTLGTEAGGALRALEAPGLCSLLRELEAISSPAAAVAMGGAAFVELCYAVVRALRPETVVETGVARGYSSAAILQALEDSGTGHLWSIDLPPLSQAADEYVGLVVPDRLRHRWSLSIGPDRHELRRVPPPGLPIDIALYDSDKTYLGMSRTLRYLWSRLRPGGLLVVDDVNTHDAFARFCLEHRLPIVACAKPNDAGVYDFADPFYVGLARKP